MPDGDEACLLYSRAHKMLVRCSVYSMLQMLLTLNWKLSICYWCHRWSLLTCAVLGGVRPLIFFSADILKTVGAQILPQVTRCHQRGVTEWPNLWESSNSCPDHNDCPMTLQLSAVVKGDRMYKRYISDFYIGDLRSGQFCDLPIIRQWAKFQFILFRVKSISNNQNTPQ